MENVQARKLKGAEERCATEEVTFAHVKCACGKNYNSGWKRFVMKFQFEFHAKGSKDLMELKDTRYYAG